MKKLLAFLGHGKLWFVSGRPFRALWWRVGPYHEPPGPAYSFVLALYDWKYNWRVYTQRRRHERTKELFE